MVWVVMETTIGGLRASQLSHLLKGNVQVDMMLCSVIWSCTTALYVDIAACLLVRDLCLIESGDELIQCLLLSTHESQAIDYVLALNTASVALPEEFRIFLYWWSVVLFGLLHDFTMPGVDISSRCFAAEISTGMLNSPGQQPGCVRGHSQLLDGIPSIDQ